MQLFREFKHEDDTNQHKNWSFFLFFYMRCIYHLVKWNPEWCKKCWIDLVWIIVIMRLVQSDSWMWTFKGICNAHKVDVCWLHFALIVGESFFKKKIFLNVEGAITHTVLHLYVIWNMTLIQAHLIRLLRWSSEFQSCAMEI